MKRRTWIAVSLAGIVAIALALGVLYFREDPVTRENFRKISTGMPEAEVMRILGQPDEVAYCEGMPNERFFLMNGWWRKTWRGGAMNISVSIDQNGFVTDACTEHPQTLMVKARQWLGWERHPLTPYRIHGGVGPASSSI